MSEDWLLAVDLGSIAMVGVGLLFVVVWAVDRHRWCALFFAGAIAAYVAATLALSVPIDVALASSIHGILFPVAMVLLADGLCRRVGDRLPPVMTIGSVVVRHGGGCLVFRLCLAADGRADRYSEPRDGDIAGDGLARALDATSENWPGPHRPGCCGRAGGIHGCRCGGRAVLVCTARDHDAGGVGQLSGVVSGDVLDRGQRGRAARGHGCAAGCHRRGCRAGTPVRSGPRRTDRRSQQTRVQSSR